MTVNLRGYVAALKHAIHNCPREVAALCRGEQLRVLTDEDNVFATRHRQKSALLQRKQAGKRLMPGQAVLGAQLRERLVAVSERPCPERVR